MGDGEVLEAGIEQVRMDAGVGVNQHPFGWEGPVGWGVVGGEVTLPLMPIEGNIPLFP